MRKVALFAALVFCACGGRALDPADAGDAGDAPDALGACTDAGLDPTALPGLVAWLEGSRVDAVNGGVVRWRDASGKGSDFVVEDSRRTPTTSAIGGRPAVHFDSAIASALVSADEIPFRWRTSDFLVVVVARGTNDPAGGEPTGYGVLFSKQLQPYPYTGVGLFLNFPGPPGRTGLVAQLSAIERLQSVETSLNDGRARVLVVRRAGSTLQARVDGAISLLSVDPSTDVSAAGVVARIGASALGEQRLAGDIAEIVAIRGPTDDATVACIERWLATKYAL